MATFKKVGTAVALSGAVAGVGVELAGTSGAAGVSGQHVHNSSSYSSYASCMSNRTGAINSAKHTAVIFKNNIRFTYIGSCNYNRSTHKYTYGHITWVNTPKIYYV